MADRRVFSEQEVTQIIRRAVEIAEEQPAASYTPGITEEELRKIAAEVGIQPNALAQAIEELGTKSPSRRGFQFIQEVERVVLGELDPSHFDLVTEGVKPLVNTGQPAVAQVGRKLEMSAWAGTGQARISVVSRNGRTQIKVRSNTLFQALMTLHPAFMGSLFVVAASAKSGLGWLGAGIALGIMALGTALFVALSKIGHRRAEELADSLRDRVEDALSESANPPAAVESPASIEQRLGRDVPS